MSAANRELDQAVEQLTDVVAAVEDAALLRSAHSISCALLAVELLKSRLLQAQQLTFR